MGRDGESEREKERVQATDKVQLITTVSVTTFYQKSILKTRAFMATVDFIDLVSSQMCILKCDL